MPTMTTDTDRAAGEARATTRSQRLRSAVTKEGFAANLGQRFALVGAWIVVIAIFGALRPSTFLTTSNFASIFGTQAPQLVLTLGLLIPLTTGDYDLSVAGVLSLSAMLLGVLNAEHHMPVLLVILICLGMGALVGAINGAFVIGFEIDPFIVTLGTGTLLSGIVLWISHSNTISGISDSLSNAVVVDRFLGIPLEFFYALALCLLVWYFFELTVLGRRLLFVGRSKSVARLSGLRVNRLRWGALIASGLISAFAGVLYAGTLGAADPTSGQSFLLPAFAGAFLGATAIQPGRFNPWGAFVAVYFLVTGITGLSFLGVESFIQDIFYGCALVIAVALSHVGHLKRLRLPFSRRTTGDVGA